MGSNRLLPALLGGVAMVPLLMAGNAFAQDATTYTGTGYTTLLERLVVGAGKEKVAIDTPQAVTVLDQDDIDREQATSTGDLFDSIPGVTMIGSDRVLGESFNIRGIGTAETSGDESRIIINVDGAKKFYEQYRMGSFFSDPELYKQVEVLRGPASSTLYGSGAIGGVINFVTKDASDFIADGNTGAVRVKGSFESNGLGTLASGIWAHQFSDNVEVLATGNWRRSENFELANGTVLSGSEFDAWSGLIKGTARFGEGDEQSMRLSYQKWNSDAQDQEYTQTDSLIGFGTVDRNVTDQTVVFSYENPDSDNPWVDLKITGSWSDTYVVQDDSAGAPFMEAEYGYKTWQGNIENTSEFTGEGWENYLTYGMQYLNQDRVAFSTVAPVPGGIPIGTHPEGNDTRLGLYVQNEYIKDERLTIIAGARGDFVWQTPVVTDPAQVPVEDFAFSPKIAALYDVTDNFSIFGSVAHTERLPSLDELYQYSGTRTPSLQLEKESANNFEAGFALTGNDMFVDGDTAALKLTGFYSDIQGLISANPSGFVGPYFSNIDNAEIYGVELEGSYDSEYFFARLGVSALVGTNVDTGTALNSIPAHKGVLTVGGRNGEHNLEYGAKITVAAASNTGVVSSDTLNNVSPPPTTEGSDAWARVDLFLDWKPDHGALSGTEVRLGIDNLFNADYRDNLSPDRSKGRTYKVTLSKQFDY